MRGAKRKGVRYFGPYSHAWAIRETLDLLLRVFPARTCSAGVFKRAGQIGRPCLLGYIGKCSAPCVGRVGAGRAPADRRGLLRLHGRQDRHVHQAARSRDAQAAAGAGVRAGRPAARRHRRRCSGRWRSRRSCCGDGTDADVVAFAEDELEAAVQVFHVRGGRVRGQRGWVVDKVEDVTTADLVEHFLTQFYGATVRPSRSTGGGPRPSRASRARCWCRCCRRTLAAVQEWLAARRGGRVEPPGAAARRQAGAARDRRAQRGRRRWPSTRSSGPATSPPAPGAAARCRRRSDSPEAPLRIECFDVSQPAGHRRGRVHGRLRGRAGPQERVPPVRHPRRWTAPTTLAAIAEVVTRRFRRYLRRDEPTAASARAGRRCGRTSCPAERPAHRPGTGRREVRLPAEPGRRRRRAPQVAAAQRALADLGIDDVALVGLAKRLEEVWLPGDDDPVILPRTSEALYLLQRVRDEAHRFAITYHRQKRSEAMIASALDDVPGLGEARRRKALLRHFGSLKRLRGGHGRRDRGGARHRAANRRTMRCLGGAAAPARAAPGRRRRRQAGGERAGQTTGEITRP